MVFANFNLPLTADGKQIFYAFGGYSIRHGSHGGFYRRALQAQNWPQIYPLGFLPLIEPRVIDTVAHRRRARRAGHAGSTTLSVGYGQNEFDFYVTDSLNTSLGPDRTIRPASTPARSATIS